MEAFAARWREGDVGTALVVAMAFQSAVAWLCCGPLAVAVITMVVDRVHCRRCPWLSNLLSALAGAASGASTVVVMVFASLYAYRTSYAALGVLLLVELLLTGALYGPRDSEWGCGDRCRRAGCTRRRDVS